MAAENELTKLADATPPHDLAAERGVLSSLLRCGEQEGLAMFQRIRRQLWRGAFFQPDHATIFDALCRVADAGNPLDVVFVHAELKAMGVLEEVGGAGHVGALLTGQFTASHGDHYARIVAERAREREVWRLGLKLAARMLEPMPVDGGCAKVVQRAVNRLWEIARDGSAAVRVKPLEELLHDFLKAKEEKNAVRLVSGVPSLDFFAGIFCFGKYTIVGARPSMGKSTFIRWLLGVFARQGTPAGLVAVEEDAPKIAGNYIADGAGIENDRVAYGEWNREEWRRATDAVGRMARWPLYVTDAAYTLDEVVAAVEMLVMEHGCRVVAVDHLHLIRHRGENREREVSEISGAIKETAKRLGVCLIAAAQLKRPEGVKYPDPPTLTDLRASGGIEEHADAVLFLHRQDYYHRGELGYAPTRACEVGVAKNRNGKVGATELRAELEYQRFSEPPDAFGNTPDYGEAPNEIDAAFDAAPAAPRVGRANVADEL